MTRSSSVSTWIRLLFLSATSALLEVSAAAAGQFEISASIGATPYVDRQSIAYRLAGPPLASSLISFDTSEPIDVVVDGATVLGFGVGWFFRPNVSLEGRIDSVALHVDNTSGVHRADIDLRGLLPGTSQQVTVGPAQLSFHRPFIASANLRIGHHRAMRGVGWTAGAGLSYLPGGGIVVNEPIALGPLTINGRSFELPIAERFADAQLHGHTPARVGANAMAGLEIQLGSRFQLRPEVRYVSLQRMRVEWTNVTVHAQLGPTGAPMGEPLTGLTPIELRSDFLLLQTALVVRF